ncbi:hypothetical protein TNCV_185811 [Trichonephila clavipes]|nr:hypothetical protein TNCV_185811 [Trichonephila clavipes]
MDNNARPHRADIVDDYLKRRDCAYGVSSRFPPPATLIELEIALQEEWRLLNFVVVYHLIENMVRRSFCFGASLSLTSEARPVPGEEIGEIKGSVNKREQSSTNADLFILSFH